jgi:hypothetical protein
LIYTLKLTKILVMSDNTAESNTLPSPPPCGDMENAEKYLNWLIDLIQTDKITVTHTDLRKFDPCSMQDHYFVPMDDYTVEVSHSKNPNTDADSFVMLFNNIKKIAAGNAEKVILAYIPLSDGQFRKFKLISDQQIERYIRQAEERRFQEAMAPVDQMFQKLSGGSTPPETPSHETPKIKNDHDYLASDAPAPEHFHQDGRTYSA